MVEGAPAPGPQGQGAGLLLPVHVTGTWCEVGSLCSIQCCSGEASVDISLVLDKYLMLRDPLRVAATSTVVMAGGYFKSWSGPGRVVQWLECQPAY